MGKPFTFQEGLCIIIIYHDATGYVAIQLGWSYSAGHIVSGDLVNRCVLDVSSSTPHTLLH